MPMKQHNVSVPFRSLKSEETLFVPVTMATKHKKSYLGKEALRAGIPRNYFEIKGKKAEKVVHELAIRSFLTDWCYLNPNLPNGKELCDLLIVFDDIVVIWQVKNLKVDGHGKYKKKEVEKNLRQLSGARRHLIDLKTPIELENPRRGKKTFDPMTIRRVHLISVLLGEGEDYFSFVENIAGFNAHVFTGQFTRIVLNELNTISDFVQYLLAKESLLSQNKGLTLIGGEEELLACYLSDNRGFGGWENADRIVVGQGRWKDLRNKAVYQAKKRADEISYFWDSILNRIHEGGKGYEVVAREIARPDRFQRRCLSRDFIDAHIRADKDNSHNPFRRVVSYENVSYCFLFQDDQEPRKKRKETLEVLCYVARGRFQQNRKVIFIPLTHFCHFYTLVYLIKVL